MNYLDIKTWQHPDIEKVCEKVLSEGFGASFDKTIRHITTKNGWEHSFEWKFDFEYPAALEIGAVDSGNIYVNLLQGDEKERQDKMHSCMFFYLVGGRYRKTYNGTVGFDMNLISRGLYWMGFPLEILNDFNGISYHEIIEWEKPRYDSWQKMWDLRPDALK